jgi:iron complex transport system ATP-binding protein
VILARALAQQAGIILLDEPSASLDLRHRLSVMETLRAEAVGRQVAVVVALHDVSLAGRYCDRLVLLSEGVIVADGRPANVLTPANLRNVFGVETVVQLDPATGYPQIWLIGPAQ